MRACIKSLPVLQTMYQTTISSVRFITNIPVFRFQSTCAFCFLMKLNMYLFEVPTMIPNIFSFFSDEIESPDLENEEFTEEVCFYIFRLSELY